MAVINVTTTVDENNNTGSLSLREAIIQSNRLTGDHTIVLESGKTYKLTRRGINEDQAATGDLDVLFGGKLTILTSGKGKATIDATNLLDQLLEARAGSILKLRNVEIKGGVGGILVTGGQVIVEKSKIFANSAEVGGGLFITQGDLQVDDGDGVPSYVHYLPNVTINNSLITGNTATNSGGGIYHHEGTLNIVNSTISQNVAGQFGGGGIKNIANAIVSNSTISDNRTYDSLEHISGGAGINNSNSLQILHSTITSNNAERWAGGLFNDGEMTIKNSTITQNNAGEQGDGIINEGTLNVQNSILAGNTGNIDVINSNGSIISQGNNLIGNATGVGTVFNKVGDKKGTATTPLNPHLGPLQNNGGLTFTHALLTGSPAINAGNTTITQDQRGYTRNGVPDIGAYEYKGVLQGTASNDILIGSPLADVINGLAGNDILTGNSGNDQLIGGAGSDILRGSDGNDSLTGGSENDSLTGGLGADRFSYSLNRAFSTTSIGIDTITDFVTSQGDQIILDKTVFTAINSNPGSGFSTVGDFASVTSNPATSRAYIVYNSVTGELFYNQNGIATGYGTGGKFVVLPDKPGLIGKDFIIQA